MVYIIINLKFEIKKKNEIESVACTNGLGFADDVGDSGGGLGEDG